jgi:hypothetical protein
VYYSISYTICFLVPISYTINVVYEIEVHFFVVNEIFAVVYNFVFLGGGLLAGRGGTTSSDAAVIAASFSTILTLRIVLTSLSVVDHRACKVHALIEVWSTSTG